MISDYSEVVTVPWTLGPGGVPVKYTGEQRETAARLYEKYDFSAADVISELGYPSRGMLPVWHREWGTRSGPGLSVFVGNVVPSTSRSGNGRQ